MTQREVLENLLKEIKDIKTSMPNGEMKQIQIDLEEMKEDMSEVRYTLLNPDKGVIVSTNKNTEFRQEMQANEKEFREQMLRVTANALRQQVMNREARRLEREIKNVLEDYSQDPEKKEKLLTGRRVTIAEELKRVRQIQERLEEFIKALNTERE